MRIAPQEQRCFFITAVGWNRRRLFQTDRNCELFLELVREYRAAGRFEVHAFVLMPDHFHAILTPAPDVSMEKAVQFLKGRFSFELKKRFGESREVWQKGFNEERLWCREDFDGRAEYIHLNPVRAGHVVKPAEFAWSSAKLVGEVDPVPVWFRG
jgi:putative transposase